MLYPHDWNFEELSNLSLHIPTHVFINLFSVCVCAWVCSLSHSHSSNTTNHFTVVWERVDISNQQSTPIVSLLSWVELSWVELSWVERVLYNYLPLNQFYWFNFESHFVFNFQFTFYSFLSTLNINNININWLIDRSLSQYLCCVLQYQFIHSEKLFFGDKLSQLLKQSASLCLLREVFNLNSLSFDGIMTLFVESNTEKRSDYKQNICEER
jgi:hypothetical protein